MLMDVKETHCREDIDILFPQGGCVPIPEITVRTTVDAKRTFDRWRKETCGDQ